MKDILSLIESGRFVFKEPWRSSDKALAVVVPVVDNIPGTRDYVVLEEVKDKVTLVDTGDIGTTEINSKANKPTLIRGGTMLKGGTQERAVQHAVVVAPQKKEQIAVQCIHASRSISSGAYFAAAGTMPAKVKGLMLRHRDQSRTWEGVECLAADTDHMLALVPRRRAAEARAAIATIPTDDLVTMTETVSKFQEGLDQILKNIPDYTNQVGIVIVDPDGVAGMEMYDHPDSWKAFSEAIVRSFSEALAREDKFKIFHPDMEAIIPLVQQFIIDIQKAEREEVFNKNDAQTVVIKTDCYVGEFTRLNDQTIHLSIVRSKVD